MQTAPVIKRQATYAIYRYGELRFYTEFNEFVQKFSNTDDIRRLKDYLNLNWQKRSYDVWSRS